MSSVSVTLKNVTKGFGEGVRQVIAVRDFSMEFPEGRLTTLLGPSGCGKTTTLRCIAGFYEPDEGDIFIGERRINGIPPYLRPTGTVFQNYALFPHMTVFENVGYGLKIKGFSSREIRGKVMQALAMLKIEELGERYPAQLSGGQQQRVAIARVLVTEPQVLLFDEPLSNLDAKLRVAMRSEIKRLHERLGITAIYVTHDQEEAMSISDIMVVMNQGIIEQVGPPIEVYRKPKTKFVAEFIGLTNFLEAEVRGLEGDYIALDLLGTIIQVPAAGDEFTPGERVFIVTRPEMIKIGEGGPGSFIGEVREGIFLGSTARYMIQVSTGELLTVDEPNPSNRGLYPIGSTLKLSLDTTSLHLQRALSP